MYAVHCAGSSAKCLIVGNLGSVVVPVGLVDAADAAGCGIIARDESATTF